MRCLKSLDYQKNLNISSLKFTYLNILKPAKTSTWYFYKILFQLLALNYQFRYNNKNYTWRLTIFPPSIFRLHALSKEPKQTPWRTEVSSEGCLPSCSKSSQWCHSSPFLSLLNNHWLKLYLFQQDRFAGFISLHDSKYKIVLDNEIFK